MINFGYCLHHGDYYRLHRLPSRHRPSGKRPGGGLCRRDGAFRPGRHLPRNRRGDKRLPALRDEVEPDRRICSRNTHRRHQPLEIFRQGGAGGHRLKPASYRLRSQDVRPGHSPVDERRSHSGEVLSIISVQLLRRESGDCR